MPDGLSRARRKAIELGGARRLGLGCMALTGVYGAISRDQATDTLKAALDAGITLFDTAPLYGSGANEDLLGEVLGSRGDIKVVTKFGLYAAPDGRLMRDSRPSTIRASVEQSMKRLRRDRIDLLLQHRQDSNTSHAEVAEAVAELIKEGKVEAFGLSAVDPNILDEWPKVTPISAIQNELSLGIAGGQVDVDAVGSAGAVFMAFSPLGRGVLAGTQPRADDDLRVKMGTFASGASAQAAVARFAEELGVSKVVASLWWALSRSDAVVAIPGCKSRAQVHEIQGEQLTRLFAERRPSVL